MSDVYQTTIFTNNFEVINRKYNSENELSVNNLTEFLGTFIIHGRIVTNYNQRLIDALNSNDYVLFYKLIKRIAKKCLKELGE